MFTLKGAARVFLHPVNRGRFVQTALRVLWWKSNQVLFHIPVIIEMVPGVKIACHPENSFSGLIVYTRIPEYEEIARVYTYLHSGDVCVDVGAHLGEFSFITASRGATVYAFEPTPSSRELLEENLELNPALKGRISLQPQAVSDKVGFLEFVIGTKAETNHIRRATETSGKILKIRSTSLDAFVDRKHISHIHLLKVDVEGAEMLVFNGAKKLFAQKRIDVVMFEVGPAVEIYHPTLRAIQEFMTSYGYTIYTMEKEQTLRRISNDWQPTSTLNVFAASGSRRSRQFTKRSHHVSSLIHFT